MKDMIEYIADILRPRKTGMNKLILNKKIIKYSPEYYFITTKKGFKTVFWG